MFKRLVYNVLIFIIASGSISCNSGQIFNEEYTFDDYSWAKTESIVFKPEITHENAGKQFQPIIHIRYITGFSYKYLNLGLILTRPDGRQSAKAISIQLITDDKKFRGEGMGDIWDYDYELSEPILFDKPGEYEIELKPIMGEESVDFINEIGISLKKIEK